MKQKTLSLAVAAVSIFLIASSWNFHRPSLALSTETVSLDDAQKGVHVCTKVYTSAESKAILHENLESLGYTPVQVTIHNQTPETYNLSAASVTLPLGRGKEVAREVTKKAMPRSLGLRIASLFFWPLAIPSTIDGILTIKSHRTLSKDLTAKTLKEEDEVIPAYSSVTRVLYVKDGGVQDRFSIYLEDTESKELTAFPTHT